MSQQLELGPAREFERDMILDLWAEQFGTYGHEPETVDSAIDRDTGGLWCYTIGTRDDLYAFAVVESVPIENMGDEYGVDTSDWPKAVNNGNIYMVCVKDAAKNNGYAKMLVRRASAYFWNEGIRRVFATCWHRENAVDSRELFSSLGYRQLAVEEGYYADVPDDVNERDCPDCGRGCECAASHWTLALDESDVRMK